MLSKRLVLKVDAINDKILNKNKKIKIKSSTTVNTIEKEIWKNMLVIFTMEVGVGGFKSGSVELAEAGACRYKVEPSGIPSKVKLSSSFKP